MLGQQTPSPALPTPSCGPSAHPALAQPPPRRPAPRCCWRCSGSVPHRRAARPRWSQPRGLPPGLPAHPPAAGGRLWTSSGWGRGPRGPRTAAPAALPPAPAAPRGHAGFAAGLGQREKSKTWHGGVAQSCVYSSGLPTVVQKHATCHGLSRTYLGLAGCSAPRRSPRRSWPCRCRGRRLPPGARPAGATPTGGRCTLGCRGNREAGWEEQPCCPFYLASPWAGARG